MLLHEKRSSNRAQRATARNLGGTTAPPNGYTLQNGEAMVDGDIEMIEPQDFAPAREETPPSRSASVQNGPYSLKEPAERPKRNDKGKGVADKEKGPVRVKEEPAAVQLANAPSLPVRHSIVRLFANRSWFYSSAQTRIIAHHAHHSAPSFTAMAAPAPSIFGA